VTDKDRKLMDEILKIKDKKSVYIIAHYYQRPEIQDIADFVGDSYAMAVQAQKAASDIILVAGVDFMAESAAILCPDKTVLSPEPEATCHMANSISVNDVLGFKEKYPESIIVSYVNTPADIKAVTDICCTSSNAHIILEKLPENSRIYFIPDQNLAFNISSRLGRKVDYFESFCPIHATLNKADIVKLKEEYPDAELLVHPECHPEVVELADYVGSTGGMINYTSSSPKDSFIIATECGIIHPIHKAAPGKKLIMASEEMICPNMKSITLNKILYSLENMQTIIRVPEEIRLPAAQALEKMIAYSS
jgi:quinolinate synthase